MSESERRDFFIWYEGQKSKVFYNRHALETYCQDYSTVLRQAVECLCSSVILMFFKAITIASACNKVLRKRFLKPYTIGLIPTGRYSGNVNYSRKSDVVRL